MFGVSRFGASCSGFSRSGVSRFRDSCSGFHVGRFTVRGFRGSGFCGTRFSRFVVSRTGFRFWDLLFPVRGIIVRGFEVRGFLFGISGSRFRGSGFSRFGVSGMRFGVLRY